MNPTAGEPGPEKTTTPLLAPACLDVHRRQRVGWTLSMAVHPLLHVRVQVLEDLRAREQRVGAAANLAFELSSPVAQRDALAPCGDVLTR